MGKRIRKITLFTGLLLFVLVAVLSTYHNIMLQLEKNQINPPGNLYRINGHQMHLYAEGPRDSAATIVLLSGSGTAAPMYDFKTLYSKLSSNYRIAVVERSGYGYSEISGAPRDIDTVVEESRSLLTAADEKGPYILMAHSISGLEALYWAQRYPDEIRAIIGLDMSVPQADIPYSPVIRPVLGIARFLGIQRISFLYPIDYVDLTDSERTQAHYLTYRNAFNEDVISEMSQTQDYIKAIHLDSIHLDSFPQLPILDFVSEDEQSRLEHEAFARIVGVTSIRLDTGHYIYHDESDRIASQVIAFLKDLD